MEKNKMKSVFMTGIVDRPVEIMFDYIKSELCVSKAKCFDYCGRSVIEVPENEYERVLKEGKKYAVEGNLELCWINQYDERRYPINSVDIAYGKFAKDRLVPGEEKHNYSMRALWEEDEYTPPYLKEYLDVMKDYLRVDEIYREYSWANKALTIASKSLDYENQMKMLEVFIDKYGYGPFETIYPLTYTGEQGEKPFQLKKTK